jgi:hypothetical protein
MSYSLLAGSWAEIVFTQPQSVSGSPGKTISISCNLSSGSIDNNYVSWYQQHPRSAPKLLIYNYNQRPNGVPNWFSGSKDSSSNSASLTISGLQPEHEADYHCLSGYDNYFTQSSRPMRKWDINSQEHLILVSTFNPGRDTLSSCAFEC